MALGDFDLSKLTDEDFSVAAQPSGGVDLPREPSIEPSISTPIKRKSAFDLDALTDEDFSEAAIDLGGDDRSVFDDPVDKTTKYDSRFQPVDKIRSLSDAGMAMVTTAANLPGSVGGLVTDIASTFTPTGMKQLSEFVSVFTVDLMNKAGFEDRELNDRGRAIKEQVLQSVIDRFGSVDAALRTLQTDPAGIASDLAPIVGKIIKQGARMSSVPKKAFESLIDQASPRTGKGVVDVSKGLGRRVFDRAVSFADPIKLPANSVRVFDGKDGRAFGRLREMAISVGKGTVDKVNKFSEAMIKRGVKIKSVPRKALQEKQGVNLVKDLEDIYGGDIGRYARKRGYEATPNIEAMRDKAHVIKEDYMGRVDELLAKDDSLHVFNDNTKLRREQVVILLEVALDGFGKWDNEGKFHPMKGLDKDEILAARDLVGTMDRVYNEGVTLTNINNIKRGIDRNKQSGREALNVEDTPTPAQTRSRKKATDALREFLGNESKKFVKDGKTDFATMNAEVRMAHKFEEIMQGSIHDIAKKDRNAGTVSSLIGSTVNRWGPSAVMGGLAIGSQGGLSTAAIALGVGAGLTTKKLYNLTQTPQFLTTIHSKLSRMSESQLGRVMKVAAGQATNAVDKLLFKNLVQEGIYRARAFADSGSPIIKSVGTGVLTTGLRVAAASGRAEETDIGVPGEIRSSGTTLP